MLFTKAAEGFLLQKSVEGLSPRTLETYERQLGHLAEFLGDPNVASITTHDLKRFFHYLRTEYTPPRWNGTERPLAAGPYAITGSCAGHFTPGLKQSWACPMS